MDDERIERLAKEHREQLASARRLAHARTEPRIAQTWDRRFPSLIAALDEASHAYANIYNGAIGEKKLSCENHGTGINVHWPSLHADARIHFYSAMKRLEECLIAFADQRTDLPVRIQVEGEDIVSRFEGEAVTPDELIALVLDRFTTEAVKRECEAM
jgi:hypothetical protein